jgi:hypothetical protein
MCVNLRPLIVLSLYILLLYSFQLILLHRQVSVAARVGQSLPNLLKLQKSKSYQR